MLKAIFLDMDDTLIVNQVLYDNARFMLAGYLRNFGVLQEETAKAISRIDAELYKTHGLSRHRCPATFEAVLKNFIPEADAETVAIARGFAQTIFDTVAPVKPGVPEALEILARHYDLYIVTAGDEVVQSKRLSLLPFRDKFKDAFIVPKKERSVYTDCAAKVGLPPSQIVMIGDSMNSDVAPAIEAGLQGILIPASVSGSYHPMHAGPVSLPEEGAFAFSSLLEVARHLDEHGSIASKKFKLAGPKPRV